MMREPSEIASVLPRPGRALSMLLALMTSVAISGALVTHWTDESAELSSWLAFRPSDRVHLFDRPWTLLTSGILTSSHGVGHLLASLAGLYFFGTALAGGGRVLRLIIASIVFGNLAVLAGTIIPIERGFHPDLVMGPLAAVAALAVVWAKENWDRQTRLFFVLPISGRAFFWLGLSVALLFAAFRQAIPEGGLAVFAGMALGFIVGRPSSMAIAVGAHPRIVDAVEAAAPAPTALPQQKRKAPPLRVAVQRATSEEDPKNKKPVTKDKRYLN